MKKILSLVLAALMAFSGTSFAIVDYDLVGNELRDLGIVQGKDNGNLGSFDRLTKEEAIVIISRMLGKENEARLTQIKSGFIDVPENSFYAPYIAWAKLNNITNGISENKFGFKQEVTAKVMASYMLRALGYNEEAKWTQKNDVVGHASKLGLMKYVSALENQQIIRGEAFQMMHNTLYTNVKGSNVSLAKKLHLKGFEDKANTNNLEIVSVSATNLKEVEVEFTKDVDKDSLKNAFTISGLSINDIKLQDDQRTVIIKLNNKMTNAKEYKFTANKIKDTNGIVMDKVSRSFTAKDVDSPEVVGEVQVVGPRTVTLTFSEPIENSSIKTSAFKVYNSYDKKRRISIQKVERNKDDKRKIDLTVSSSFKDGNEYLVEVNGVRDYAGYANKIQDVEFAYSQVKDSPIMEVVEADQKYVKVQFDRPVKGLTAENFYHSYSSYKALEIYPNKEEMDKKSGQKINKNDYYDSVYVVFATGENKNRWDHPLQEGDVRVNIIGSKGGSKIVDRWNNSLNNQEVVINVTVDKEIPAVSEIEVKGKDKFEITFTKSVQLPERNCFEFLDENGKKISNLVINNISKNGDKRYEIVLSRNMKGKTIIINVKNIKDDTLRENKIDGVYSQTVTFSDTEFKGATKAIADFANNNKNKDNKILIIFDDAVDPDSAQNYKNYKFNIGGSIIQVDAEFNLVSGSDSIVEVNLGRGDNSIFTNKHFNMIQSVMVSNAVVSVNGNKIDEFAKELKIENINSDSLVPNTIKAIAKDKIEIEFDTQIRVKEGKDINYKQISVKGAEGEYKVDSADISSDNKIITLNIIKGEDKENYVKSLLPADSKDLKVTIKGSKEENSSQDAYFESFLKAPVNFENLPVKDEIKPSIELLSNNNIKADYEKDVQLVQVVPNVKFENNDTKNGAAELTVKATFNVKFDEDLAKDDSLYSKYSVTIPQATIDSVKVSKKEKEGNILIVEAIFDKDNSQAFISNLISFRYGDKYDINKGEYILGNDYRYSNISLGNKEFYKLDKDIIFNTPITDTNDNKIDKDSEELKDRPIYVEKNIFKNIYSYEYYINTAKKDKNSEADNTIKPIFTEGIKEGETKLSEINLEKNNKLYYKEVDTEKINDLQIKVGDIVTNKGYKEVIENKITFSSDYNNNKNIIIAITDSTNKFIKGNIIEIKPNQIKQKEQNVEEDNKFKNTLSIKMGNKQNTVKINSTDILTEGQKLYYKADEKAIKTDLGFKKSEFNTANYIQFTQGDDLKLNKGNYLIVKTDQNDLYLTGAIITITDNDIAKEDNEQEIEEFKNTLSIKMGDKQNTVKINSTDILTEGQKLYYKTDEKAIKTDLGFKKSEFNTANYIQFTQGDDLKLNKGNYLIVKTDQNDLYLTGAIITITDNDIAKEDNEQNNAEFQQSLKISQGNTNGGKTKITYSNEKELGNNKLYYKKTNNETTNDLGFKKSNLQISEYQELKLDTDLNLGLGKFIVLKLNDNNYICGALIEVNQTQITNAIADNTVNATFTEGSISGETILTLNKNIENAKLYYKEIENNLNSENNDDLKLKEGDIINNKDYTKVTSIDSIEQGKIIRSNYKIKFNNNYTNNKNIILVVTDENDKFIKGNILEIKSTEIKQN